MSDNVEVTVEESEPEPEAPAPVVVTTPVIVNDSGEGNDDSNTLVALGVVVGDLSARVTALEERNTAQDAAIEEAQISADVATDIAIDAATSAAEEPEGEDNPPVKPHWVHRSLGDLFGSNK